MDNQTEFHITKSFTDMVLTPLIVDINTSAKEGDIMAWFNALRTLFRNVKGHQRFNKEIAEELDKRFKNVRDEMNKIKSPLTNSGQAYKKLLESNIKWDLDYINIELITEIYRTKMLFPTYKHNPNTAVFEM
jgi:hypothetical protein